MTNEYFLKEKNGKFEVVDLEKAKHVFLVKGPCVLAIFISNKGYEFNLNKNEILYSLNERNTCFFAFETDELPPEIKAILYFLKEKENE